MTEHSSFEGKIIKLNKPYPITNDEDKILGYTEAGDMAVITFAEIGNKIENRKIMDISDELSIAVPLKTEEESYFEIVIVSGKYIGVDSLALNLSDIMNSTFVFNKIDCNNGEERVILCDKKNNYEYV